MVMSHDNQIFSNFGFFQDWRKHLIRKIPEMFFFNSFRFKHKPLHLRADIHCLETVVWLQPRVRLILQGQTPKGDVPNALVFLEKAEFLKLILFNFSFKNRRK